MNSLTNVRMMQVLARRARSAGSIATIACALLASACDVHGVSQPGTLSSLVVSPNPQVLAVNATQQFTAVGKDFAGVTLNANPTWTVVAGGGTITASGMFTAGTTPGTYTSTVKATNGGLSSMATVTVVVGPLATITVTPNPDTTVALGGKQFTAVGRDAAGNTVAITPVWSVSNGGGAINASSGLFTAGSATGTYTNTIRATSGAISGTATETVIAGALATITVTPNPASLSISAAQQFTATGRDASGNLVAMVPTWSVTNGGGTIAAGTGLFTAGTATGTFANTVRATSGAISGTATVTVSAGPLALLVVSPNPATMGIGGAQQFTAIGQDAGGNIVSVTPIWSVVNGGGTIGAASGLFTAGNTVGTFANTVVATVGTTSGSATVSVVGGPLATITVTPNPASMSINTGQQFTATGRDASGNVVSIAPVWSVTNGGGTIGASSGLFTAGTTTGTFTNTVRATSGAISGSATVTVNAGPLASIIVTPNPDTTAANGLKQFVAAGRDAAGNSVAITPTWSVENGGGTINSSTGLFTAGTLAGTFTNTIRATSGIIAGSATEVVTVAAVPVLTTITVSPNPTSVATNGTRQFTAIGRDANGNPMSITPSWSVVNNGGTIVSTTGLFTAGTTTGTFTNTVRATSGTVSGTATVTVTSTVLPPTVNLGGAGFNGIMAGTAVTCITGGIVHADVSISPGNTITGFGPCVINGVQHLNDAVAAQAQIDLTTAYNTLAAMPCPPANAIAADLGGTTKPAGVYCTASGIGVTGTLTLDGGGDPNATFVFQAGTSLTTAGNIVLINGAQAKNVYWKVGSSATIGTASQWQGNILALTSITLVDNATLIGRALARNGAVTLGTNNVITLP